MKAFLPLCLLAAGISAQTPQQQPTRTLNIDVGKMAGTVSPDTVVATIEGKKFTAAAIESVVQAMPPQVQQNFNNDRKEFVRQLGLLLHLANVATTGKLENESPYKERLEYMRTQVLAQSAIDNAGKTMVISAEDQRKFYDENPDRFTQVKIKVIYVPFAASAGTPPAAGGKKQLTEAEAKAKAENVVKQARAGVDFVKLVKENSEDAASAAKDGDFGSLKKSDQMPEPVKTAVFSLKKGDVSDPVRQANGFYIFRAEEAGLQGYDQVRDDIHREIQQRRFQQWFEETRKKVDVKFENEAYFTPKAAPNAPGAPVQAAPAQPAAPKK